MGETRKTVLFIVEGPSDKSALEKIFIRGRDLNVKECLRPLNVNG